MFKHNLSTLERDPTLSRKVIARDRSGAISNENDFCNPQKKSACQFAVRTHER